MTNRILQYHLQTLSPVHVGSGGRRRNGLDFFPAGGRTWLIDQPELEAALAKNPKALDDFAGGDELHIHALAARHQLDLAQIVATSYRGEATAQDMFEFVRNGTGAPYLPGSSIKGSLRTALLWKISRAWQAQMPQLLETVLQAKDERWAGEAIVEKTFNITNTKTRPQRRNDANRDLMRVLHVSDCHFGAADLELADTRIFNLTSETLFGWKNISKRRNEKEPREATQLATEALRVHAAAPVTLTIEDFLFTDAVKPEADFQQHQPLFNDLPALCNDYAKRQIAKQRAFFAQYKLDALVHFYDELEQQRASLPAGDFLLRLAWGSGWQGMTGELIENPDDLQRVRQKFALGKFEMQGALPEECPICHSKKIRPDNRREETGFCFQGMHTFPAPGVKKTLFPIFPKTRKLALEAGQPRYPFGWVRFSQQKPETPPADDRRHFTPPAFKASARIDDRLSRPPNLPLPKIPAPPPSKPAPAIRPGDKLRAVVLNYQNPNGRVRLLEKDANREVDFTGSFLPITAGDTLEVRVKATNPAGDQIVKIEFVKKIVAG